MSGVSLSDLMGVGIALAAGLLIGLERGWHQRDLPDGHRVAGLRTFALIGLLGGLSGLLAQRWGAIVLVVVLAVVALLVLAGYIVTARMHSVMGLTTAMAAITTFLVGVLAAGGSTLLAAAVATYARSLDLSTATGDFTDFSRLAEATLQLLDRQRWPATAELFGQAQYTAPRPEAIGVVTTTPRLIDTPAARE